MMNELLIDINGSGVLKAQDGVVLRVANDMDARDKLGRPYRFMISGEISGFSRDFFPAFFGPSMAAILERYCRENKNKPEIDDPKILLRPFHLDSIEGDQERTGKLISDFVHGMKNSAAVVIGNYEEQCREMKERQAVDGSVRPMGAKPQGTTGLTTYAFG